MTNKINASSTSGMITSGSNSNILELQADGVTGLTVNSDASINVTNSLTVNGVNFNSAASSASVTALSNLKALTIRPANVTMQGRLTPNDGGGGQFYWNPGDNTTPDDVMIIQCTTGPSGRYRRIHNREYDPRWWGAKADGNTDDTIYWNAMLAFIQASIYGGTIIVPPVYQVINGPLLFTGDSLAIKGSLTSSRIVKASTTGNLFQFIGDKYQFEGFIVECAGTHTAGTIFSLSTTGGNVSITNVWTNGGYDVLTLNAGAQLYIDDCTFNNFRRHGIKPGPNWGGLTIISNVNMNGDENNQGSAVYLEAGDTFNLSNLNCAGELQPIVFSPPANKILVNIFCTNVLADGIGRTSTGFDGWLLNGSASGAKLGRIFLTNCWAGVNQRDGFRIVGGGGIDVVHLVNCISVTNLANGIYMTSDPRNVRIHNCTISGNSLNSPGIYSGIRVDNFCSDFEIIGGKIGPTEFVTTNNHKYNIEITGTNHDRYRIESVTLYGGNVGTVLDQGAGPSKVIRDNFGYDFPSQPINVKTFGAKGDGVTNDTSAIQAALNAMPTSNGLLYFPPGTYIVNPLTLTGKYNFTLRGDGRETSILKLNTTGTLLTISGSNFATIKDMSFQLNALPQTIANTTGVIVNNASGNTIFDKCDFLGFALDGLFFQGTVGTQLSGNRVVDCYFLGNGRYQLHGLYNNDYHINKNQYGMLVGIAHAQAGCYLDNCGAGNYTENYHWNNVRGLWSLNSTYTTWALNRFEESDHEGVYIDGGYGCIFTGNKIHTNSQAGNGLYANVYVINTTNLEFTSNNIFSWNSLYTNYGVNFDGTNTGLSIGKNRISGYDVTNFGPIRLAGNTFATGVSADKVLEGSSKDLILANSTVYLGTNGESIDEYKTYYFTSTRYAVLGYFVAFTNSPGGSETYNITLRKNGIDTPMTASATASAFATLSATITPEILLDYNQTTTLKLVTSSGANSAAFRYFILLAEY